MLKLGVIAFLAASAGCCCAMDTLMILKSRMPTAPAVADRETVKLISDVAEMRTLEAAYMLIDAMAYNIDPGNSNEDVDDALKIPAIPMLKQYFGQDVCPLLYFTAISSKNAWLRCRCALAIRYIADAEHRVLNDAAFGLHESKKQNAVELRVLLEAPKIKVEFATKAKEDGAKIDAAIDRLQREQKINKEK